MYKYLLFDLDGTLTESGEGISNAAAYAFEKMGMPVPSREELLKFVGPPLKESFPRFGVAEENVGDAIVKFREYFSDRGWCENKPYPGVAEMCAKLHDAGYKLIVATSKIEPQAVRIMEYFGLASYFTDVVGGMDEAGRSTKAEVVACVLGKYGIADTSEAVMIGDRHYDVLGAAECGVKAVGVTYGYGSRSELEEAGALKVADTVEELTEYFLAEKNNITENIQKTKGEDNSMTIKELVAQMTLEEKAKLVGGADAWHTAAIERLGIPEITVSDGPHGLRKCDTGDVADMAKSRQAVCFPTGVCLASTFNRDAARHMGELLGNECLAEGVDVLLGPAINIKRSPLCGRNFEYLSEDPFVAGQMASAYVQGVQSKGVGVSLKHFAVNNQEKRRMTVSAVVDERTLREIYLSAFEEVVKSAKPDTVMCSYNRINGVYSSENPWLLHKVLRTEWGFDGFVMSDWGAVCDRAAGLIAGLDLEMPSSNGINEEAIINAAEEGLLDEKYLDIAVENILKKVDKYTGFMAAGNVEERPLREKPEFDYVADHKEARKIAREGMVLLKNDGVLPLNAEDNIVFIGEFAKTPRYQGGGSSHINPTRVISALSASKRHTKVEYARGFSATKDVIEEDLIEEAVNKAERADVAVIFAGLPDSFESEGYDREHMRLPQCQNRLIREVAKVQPNTVVVLHNGSPVSMPWIGNVNAVLEAYLAGEASGEAVVDILFGVVNPSGKLAETFPISIKDTPCYDYFPGNRLTVEYREGLFVGYRYYDRKASGVLFPFGHGLSYTTFAYDNLVIESGDKSAKLKFTIKNTGKVPGAEVAQVYVGRNASKVFRPIKELKGFEKVFLKPGEQKDITIELDERAFSYYCVGAHKWSVEPGAYIVSVGSSSRDIRLRGEVNFEHEADDIWQYTREELPTYYFGDPSSVSDSEFEKLLCAPIPESTRPSDMKLDMNSTLEDARECKWGARVMKIVDLIEKGVGAVKGDSSGMVIATIGEMPFHSLACMSGGALNKDMTEALIGLLNEENVAENWKILGLGGIDTVTAKMGGMEQIRENVRTGAGKAVDYVKNTAGKVRKGISDIKQRMTEDEEEEEEE